MKIYFDLVLILNFFLDFLLIFTVNILLKRNMNLKRLLFGSIIGSFSILFLFIPLNNITMNIIKLLISILMIISSFGYKDIRYTFKNFIYLYLVSIILGGSLYLFDITFTYKNNGLIFYNEGAHISIFTIIIITPIIMYYYVKQSKSYKLNYTNYHDVIIHYNNKEYIFKGYLDTGNNLYDPYKKRLVMLINCDDLFRNCTKFIYVPYNSLNNKGIIRCFMADKIFIDNKEYKNILIGESINKIKIDNIDCILPNKLREEL